MKDYEIHLPAKKRKPARQEERPVIRISSEAYNTLVEIETNQLYLLKILRAY